jgi:hypothetical protein
MAAGMRKTSMMDDVAPTREKTVLMEGTKIATGRVKARTDAAMPTWTDQRKGTSAQVRERIDLRREGVHVGRCLLHGSVFALTREGWGGAGEGKN